MSMKKVLGLILAGVLAAGSLIACGGESTAATAADAKAGAAIATGDAKAKGDTTADTTGAGSGEKETLRVAMGCAYAPYSWAQPDNSNGAMTTADSNELAYEYDAMMVKEIREELGYDPGTVRLDWGSSTPATTAGQVDYVVAGQPITSGHLQAVDFTEPYYYVTIVTLVEEDNKYADAKGVADLAEATCTSQQSTIWHNTCLPQTQGANILTATTSAPDVLTSLNADKCDLVVTDQPTGKGALIAYPNFKMVEFGGDGADFQVTDEDVNIDISLKKGSTELKDAINNALTRMTKDDFSRMMDEAIFVQLLAD